MITNYTGKEEKWEGREEGRRREESKEGREGRDEEAKEGEGQTKISVTQRHVGYTCLRHVTFCDC